jgi:hypothetical protein
VAAIDQPRDDRHDERDVAAALKHREEDSGWLCHLRLVDSVSGLLLNSLGLTLIGQRRATQTLDPPAGAPTTAPMNEPMRFITDRERELYSMVELCERYGVSRKTGYKWVERYEREGLDGLREQSRAPHHCPHRMAADVATAICAARRQHPSWGSAKLLQWLKPRHPELALPAPSTAGDLLARRGLVKKRRCRRHYTHPGVVPPTTNSRMISGPQISRATSGPAMASIAIR